MYKHINPAHFLGYIAFVWWVRLVCLTNSRLFWGTLHFFWWVRLVFLTNSRLFWGVHCIFCRLLFENFLTPEIKTALYEKFFLGGRRKANSNETSYDPVRYSKKNARKMGVSNWNQTTPKPC